MAAKQQVRRSGPRVHEETVRRMERATGTLGTAAIAAMDERLPWFRNMSAENRSWLGLVAQAGIAAFLDWIRHPERNRPALTEVFGTAPRELARAVSLQHAVEMVRVIIDAVVRGEAEDSLHAWASALNWSSSPVAVVVGTIGDEDSQGGAEPLIEDIRAQARRARLDMLAGVQGNRLILVLGGADDPITAAERFAGRFGPGPVIAGPLVRDLRAASVSARAALAALRAAPAWPEAPRPSGADDLLPERALDGDPDAKAALISDVYEPLAGGGHALLDTLTTYLEQGSSLEATARLLFVHPNTVRYRLRRVAELTEYTPSAGRDGFTLWVAIVLGRLAAKRGEREAEQVTS